jgi:hypothetical protein
LFKKLADLANELDKRGYTKEADEIDAILKDAGLLDWLSGKKPTQCTCNCDNCIAGKARGGPHALEYHQACETGKCEVKLQQSK